MKLLEEIINEDERYASKVKELTASLKESFFETLFKDIFEKHPTLDSFAWTQYSPYFNDGEPCIFRVHGINEINEEYTYNSKYSFKEELEIRHESVPKDYYERMFGDGYKITVRSNGTIDIEDYDHD